MVRGGNRQLKSHTVKESTAANNKQLPAASPDLSMSNVTSNASPFLWPVLACSGCGVVISNDVGKTSITGHLEYLFPFSD